MDLGEEGEAEDGKGRLPCLVPPNCSPDDKKKKKKKKKDAAPKKRKEDAVQPSQRIENLFFGGGKEAPKEPAVCSLPCEPPTHSLQSKRARIMTKDELDKERQMDAMLDDLMDNPLDLTPAQKKRVEAHQASPKKGGKKAALAATYETISTHFLLTSN